MKLLLRSQGQPELPRVSLFLRATLRALTVVGLPILVLAPFDRGGSPAARPAVTPPLASAPAPPARLAAGSTLRSGGFLESANRSYRLEMQANGNLVLSWEGHVLWSSHTTHHPGAVASMQRDGNLVVYQGRRAIWNTRTSHRGRRNYELLLQSNGLVVIDTPTHKVIWEARTSIRGIREFPGVSPA